MKRIALVLLAVIFGLWAILSTLLFIALGTLTHAKPPLATRVLESVTYSPLFAFQLYFQAVDEPYHDWLIANRLKQIPKINIKEVKANDDGFINASVAYQKYIVYFYDIDESCFSNCQNLFSSIWINSTEIARFYSNHSKSGYLIDSCSWLANCLINEQQIKPPFEIHNYGEYIQHLPEIIKISQDTHSSETKI